MQESHDVCDLPLLPNENSFLENSIFKTTFKHLSLLLASLKVEPLAKPKSGLNFFLNTAKSKTKVFLGKTEDKSLNFKPKPWLRPFVNTGPGLVFTKGLRLSQVLGLNPALKLRLLSQLSFVLKPYSQRVT